MRSNPISNNDPSINPVPGRDPAKESKQVASLRNKLERHLKDFDHETTEDKVKDAKERLESTLHNQASTRVELQDHTYAEWEKPTNEFYNKIVHRMQGG